MLIRVHRASRQVNDATYADVRPAPLHEKTVVPVDDQEQLILVRMDVRRRTALPYFGVKEDRKRPTSLLAAQHDGRHAHRPKVEVLASAGLDDDRLRLCGHRFPPF